MNNKGEETSQQVQRRQSPVLVGVVALMAGVAVALIQYKIPTVMTLVMAQFSMSAGRASWLMSVFTLVGIFTAIPSGYLAGRFGAKRMMIIALGIAVAGSLLGLLARTSSVLLVSRAVEGVALTLLTTCGPLLIRSCVEQQNMGVAMGIWGIWGCLGSTIAALVTPTLFAARGFGGVWGTFAAVAVVAAVALAALIRVPKRVTEGRQPPQAVRAGAVRYREIFNREVVLFLFGFAVFNVCLLAVLSFVPTILQMQGFDPTLSGLVSTAPMLLSVISSPLFGMLSDRMGRCKPLLVASAFVMGPCTFALYTTTGWLMGAAVLVMGLVGMGATGVFLSGYLRVLPSPHLASVGMGVMICVQGVGQFLGTFLVQLLLGADLGNWGLAGSAIMVLGLIGATSIALCKMR